MTAVDLAAVEELGEQVWDALTTAGHAPSPEGSGTDGFDVLRPSGSGPAAVAVIWRAEGVMYGMPVAVRRKHLYWYEAALTEAGFVVRMVKEEARKPGAEPEPVVVAAALEERAADECAALAGAALAA